MNMQSLKQITFVLLSVWRSRTFLAVLTGGLFLSTGEAAVRELWRVRSTDTRDAHSFNVAASAVDTNGNTVIAGTYSTSPSRNLFVASYDSTGAKLWEFTGRPTFRVFVDGLVIRPDGAVIVSFAEHDGQFQTTSSLLCVAGGELRWERSEPNVAYGAGYRKLKVNESGELFIYGFDWLEQPAVLNFPASVSKYDIAGHALWLTRPPFISIGTAYSAMPFDLSSAGHPVVGGVGHDGFPNVVACLDAVTGRVRWQRRPRGIFSNNVAVRAGPRSICVSGDDGYVIYANNGRRLGTRRDHRYFADRITPTREGGFLLLSPHNGIYQAVLSPSGRVRWNNFSEPQPAIGFFEHAVAGYVRFGITGSLLVYSRLDQRGRLVSSEVLGEYPQTSSPPLGMTVLAAPDGTWRVVSNQGNYDFSITAYGEDADDLVQNEAVRPDKFVHFPP